MKALRYAAASLGSVILLESCYIGTEYRTYQDVQESGPGSIRLMVKDSSIYELSSYALLDSAVEGSGSHLVNGGEEPFTGKVPFSAIVYIEGREFSFWRTALTVGMIGVTGSLMAKASSNRGLRVWRPMGGGSCPFVYAWDGERYALQGEAFGTAFGSALECETTCMLPAAAVQGDIVRVRMTNERPETHYVNCVSLMAYASPDGASVSLDSEGRAWPVAHPLSPVSCAPELMRNDGKWWISDLSGATAAGEYHDVVEIVLPRPQGAEEGSLVIHAINTHLINAVYEIVFGYLGDQSLQFIRKIEHDQALIARLKGWIQDCALTVEVRKNGQWERMGALLPEANEVPFSKIVRISTPGGKADSIHVRLTALADTWKIDAVEIDWTPALPLRPIPLALRSAAHSVLNNVVDDVRASDSMYSVLLPGEQIDLEFESVVQHAEQQKVSYALRAAGYLYEWLPPISTPAYVPAFLAGRFPSRTEVVTNLVNHREAFLPVVYERWRELRIKNEE